MITGKRANMVLLTRTEVGRRLAQGLGAMLGEEPVVLALSPGGVTVASEVARELHAPLDVVAAHRLEVPGRLRSTFGAVADGHVLLLEDRIRDLQLPGDYVTGLVGRVRREVEQEAAALRNGQPAVPLAHRTVVLVDDGSSEAVQVASAATALRRAGADQVIFAAPTASPELWRALVGLCDQRLVLYEPAAQVKAIVYDPEFAQTTQYDVRAMVRRSREHLAVSS
jgi:predicted phosphoribosyltransferase